MLWKAIHIKLWLTWEYSGIPCHCWSRTALSNVFWLSELVPRT